MSQIGCRLSAGANPSRVWHELYQSAMLGLEDDKVLQRISEARHAILDRAGRSFLTGSPSDERAALNDALQALRVLERVAVKREACRVDPPHKRKRGA